MTEWEKTAYADPSGCCVRCRKCNEIIARLEIRDTNAEYWLSIMAAGDIKQGEERRIRREVSGWETNTLHRENLSLIHSRQGVRRDTMGMPFDKYYLTIYLKAATRRRGDDGPSEPELQPGASLLPDGSTLLYTPLFLPDELNKGKYELLAQGDSMLRGRCLKGCNVCHHFPQVEREELLLSWIEWHEERNKSPKRV